jgi:hypothetical protein
MRRVTSALLCLLLLLPLAAAADPLDDAVGAAGVDLPFCDAFDPARCLLPWPSDVFTTPDATTPTGLRLDLPVAGMPRNRAGKPIVPTEWNRNDGFSPGTALLTLVPGLDMAATFGRETTITDPDASLAADSPVVVVNTATGERHPVWAELDTHPETAAEDRLLILRPLVNFDHATRYVVGLRDLRSATGPIAPGDAFAAAVEDGDPRLADVLPPLAAQGVAADELVLAWDFTIASAENLTGRALAMRDQAFAALGDEDLADLVVPEGSDAPAFTVTSSTTTPGDPERFRRVEGTISVPNFLVNPQGTEAPPPLPRDLAAALPSGLTGPYGEASGLRQHVPGSRLAYASATPGPMDTPVRSTAAPTWDVPFLCTIPDPALQGGQPAIGMLYGHGLLGGRGESGGGSTERMRERGYAPCAVDWAGMSTPDVLNVATILTDVSNFPTLADRAQQGFLNFLLLGRAIVHPDGLTSHPAFQDDAGRPLLRTAATPGDLPALVYDGNSQGGIMGGALAALSPDLTRATLGVLGMNYSTLLNRSVDWEGKGQTPAEAVAGGDLPAYASIMYAAYPDKVDQQIVFQLIQSLWDRAETNGYAHRIDDPLPGTPAHQVLLHSAWGDYQVANVSAEVEARTIGARYVANALPEGLHWSDDPLFGFEALGEGCDGCSALVHWDSGNGTPPDGNVPPQALGQDPHEHPRRDPMSAEQRDVFYRTGRIADVHAGGPYRTYEFPVHGFLADGVTPNRAERPDHP